MSVKCCSCDVINNGDVTRSAGRVVVSEVMSVVVIICDMAVAAVVAMVTLLSLPVCTRPSVSLASVLLAVCVDCSPLSARVVLCVALPAVDDLCVELSTCVVVPLVVVVCESLCELGLTATHSLMQY